MTTHAHRNHRLLNSHDQAPDRALFSNNMTQSLKTLYAGLVSGLGLVALLLFLAFSLTPQITQSHAHQGQVHGEQVLQAQTQAQSPQGVRHLPADLPPRLNDVHPPQTLALQRSGPDFRDHL